LSSIFAIFFRIHLVGEIVAEVFSVKEVETLRKAGSVRINT